MSMFWLWDRLMGDPERIEAEERQIETTRARTDEADAAPPVLRCRACGYEGAERYCPHCLADTMVLVRKPTARR